MEGDHEKLKTYQIRTRSSTLTDGKAGFSGALQVPQVVKRPPKGNVRKNSKNVEKSPESRKLPKNTNEVIQPELNEANTAKEYGKVATNLPGALSIATDADCYTQKTDYQELLRDPAQLIRHTFLVEMPADFFKFWELCQQPMKPGQTSQTLLEKLDLQLVGPFDFLTRNMDMEKLKEPREYLRHCRFYYDPPEFQTVFVKKNSQIHYGYWRDDPKDKDELLMARNDSSKGCAFHFIGANCFETVLYYLKNDAELTSNNRPALAAFQKSLEQFAKSYNIPLEGFKKLVKKRDQKVVCQLFHRAGLVVPVDHKTQVGYRGMYDSDAKLKRILKRLDIAQGDEKGIAGVMEELQPFISDANFAIDECDFGAAIELGIDLFCSGHKELHNVIKILLGTGYSLIGRSAFITILESHLENRVKGSDVSVLH